MRPAACSRDRRLPAVRNTPWPPSTRPRRAPARPPTETAAPFARADRPSRLRSPMRCFSPASAFAGRLDHRRPRPPHRQRFHQRLGGGPAGARRPPGGGLRLGPAPRRRDRGRRPRLRELLRLALSAAVRCSSRRRSRACLILRPGRCGWRSRCRPMSRRCAPSSASASASCWRWAFPACCGTSRSARTDFSPPR